MTHHLRKRRFYSRKWSHCYSKYFTWSRFITKDLRIPCSQKKLQFNLRKYQYERNHQDRAIHNYREIERRSWSPESLEIINRIRETVFHPEDELMPATHVLDIDSNGEILPHVDNVKFVGRALAGLSLLSDAVMRFEKCESQNEVIDVFLPRRSLYIMENNFR